MRRKRPITIASRRGWNRLVDWWFSHRLREVRVIDAPRWRPPWSCSLLWDPAGECWTVSVVPGWCESPGGEPSPSVRTRARLAPSALAATEAEDPDDWIEALLMESPRMEIGQNLWRAVGTDALALDASAREAVPAELAALGVLPAATVRESESGLTTQIEGVAADRANARLARAVELMLEHGRPVVELVYADDLGGPQLELSVGPATPPAPRLVLETRLPDPEALPRTYLPTARGVAIEEGVDRLPIATLWLVSPRGEPQGSEPDGRWTAWVQQRVSRNVAYEAERPDIEGIQPLTFPWLGSVRGLGLGAGTGIIDSLAGDLRSRAAELDAMLAGLRSQGRFVAF